MGVRVPSPAQKEYRTDEQGMLNEEVNQDVSKPPLIIHHSLFPALPAGGDIHYSIKYYGNSYQRKYRSPA